VSEPLFPLWQVDRREYDAVCAYLGITPRDHIYDALATHLAEAPFRVAAPEGLFGRLAGRRLTPWTIARLDLATRLFAPAHPMRYVLNGTIALHEVDGDGYPELAAAPTGWRAYASMLEWGLGLVLNLALTLPWLAWQGVLHLLRAPFGAARNNLRGERVLITGVGRGLGRDLMLHCLERGADVVGVVRDGASFERLRAELPAHAPLTLVVADLATPGALTEALEAAKLERDTFSIVIASAGVKHDGRTVASLASVRDTLQVNVLAPVELVERLVSPSDADGGAHAPRAETTAIVLVSSMGRWHGMHHSGGYNASKAALSIWGESFDMEARGASRRRFTVTIVEPGMFASGMTKPTGVGRFLMAPRSRVAATIVSGALAGRSAIRPPFWFALLTWAVCLAGRDFRFRILARARPREGRH
jgi:short-subunit dehydrogenase